MNKINKFKLTIKTLFNKICLAIKNSYCFEYLHLSIGEILLISLTIIGLIYNTKDINTWFIFILMIILACLLGIRIFMAIKEVIKEFKKLN